MRGAWATLGLLAIMTVGACRTATPPAGTSSTTSPSAPAAPAAQTRQEPAMPIRTVDAQAIARAIEEKGIVAVVRVESSEIFRPGTRSESVLITCAVVESIHGSPPAKLGLQRYTHGGNPILRRGGLYVVATTPNPAYAPRQQLNGFVETTEAQQAEVVKAHRALIAGGGK